MPTVFTVEPSTSETTEVTIPTSTSTPVSTTTVDSTTEPVTTTTARTTSHVTSATKATSRTTQAPTTTGTPPQLAPYTKPYDFDAILADLIQYCQDEELGLTYIYAYPEGLGSLSGTVLTKDNVSWWPSYPTNFYKVDPFYWRKHIQEHLTALHEKGYSFFGYFYEPIQRAGEYEVYIFHC